MYVSCKFSTTMRLFLQDIKNLASIFHEKILHSTFGNGALDTLPPCINLWILGKNCLARNMQVLQTFLLRNLNLAYFLQVLNYIRPFLQEIKDTVLFLQIHLNNFLPRFDPNLSYKKITLQIYLAKSVQHYFLQKSLIFSVRFKRYSYARFN